MFQMEPMEPTKTLGGSRLCRRYLLSHRKADVQANRFDSVVSVTKAVGLQINAQKTKIIKIGTANTDIIHIGADLGEVDEFCYLGRIVSKTEVKE